MRFHELLLKCEGSWVFRCINEDYLKCINFTVSLDGSKMECLDDLYSELEKGFYLPQYFGRNYNDLLDVLSDLSWIDKNSYTIVIKSASSLLLRENNESLAGFIEVLARAGREWSVPIRDGEVWDRPCVPFHTVFQLSETESRKPLLEIPLMET